MMVPGMVQGMGSPLAGAGGSGLVTQPDQQQPSNMDMLMAAGQLQKLGRLKGQKDKMAPKPVTRKLKVI